MTLKFENLDKSTAGDLIELCDVKIYGILFIGITIPKSDLGEGQVNISFAELNPKTGAVLVSLLRKENIDFGLTFNNLNYQQIEKIIETNPPDQEDVEIPRVKSLSELFTNEMRPTLELSEFAARGIEYLLEINEKQFIPWRSIACVGALASAQMALGGVLVATGFGANVGMGLITEGVADLVTAARIYSSRQFTWSDYAKQKAVSLVISATCLGWQKIQDAGKGLKNIVSGVKQEVLEQAGTQLMNNGKTISKTLVQTSKNLKSLAMKQIGVTTGETIVRTGLNQIADSLSHFALEQLKPKISATIQHHVEAKFRESALMHLVRKMYAIEVITVKSGKTQANSIPMQGLKDKIDKIVTKIISPKDNFWRKQWESIGRPLCQGILSDSKYLGSSFSTGMRIAGILNGIATISTMIDNVHDQLLHKLSLKNKEEFQMTQLLAKYCHLDQNTAKQMSEILKQHNVICTETQENETLNLQAFEGPHAVIYQINLRCDPNDQLVVMEFLKTLYNHMDSMKMDQLSQIIKSVSDMITSQILSVTESQLISPVSSYAMGALTNSISSSLQDKLIKKGLDDDRKSDATKLQELENKENKTAEDKNMITELKSNLSENDSLRNQNQTYSNLINYNAMQYTIAYSQCEMIHHAQQQKADKNSRKDNPMRSKEVKAHAEKTRKPGGNPANAADMLSMAAENGIKLKIVDDENYQLTAEEKAQGIHVVVFSKGERDQNGTHGVGHYRLLNLDGVLVDVQSNENDCGFAVMAKLTGKSVEELRVEHANNMVSNAASFGKSLEAQDWIISRHPKEANSLLFKGAGKKKREERRPICRNLYEVERDGIKYVEKDNVSEKEKDNFLKTAELGIGPPVEVEEYQENGKKKFRIITKMGMNPLDAIKEVKDENERKILQERTIKQFLIILHKLHKNKLAHCDLKLYDEKNAPKSSNIIYLEGQIYLIDFYSLAKYGEPTVFKKVGKFASEKSDKLGAENCIEMLGGNYDGMFEQAQEGNIKAAMRIWKRNSK